MAKTLRTDIVIGGQADASLFALGDQIQQLGNQINQVSRLLIDFGKDSVDNYVSYEDAMLDAQVALATTYTNASELAQVMETLDKNALQWASDTRFTTNDVANAISNAAHAGWDLDKILAGIPAAMRIAQAGGMDLSTGLEYLVDIANAAKIDFGDLSEFVDIWAFAANKSSTDINEMGAAMQKMGASMQFVNGDMGALTTMLAVLANNGAKGAEAGTLLRNSLIRLVAPTKKAADTMAGLSLSEEEADAIYADAEAIEAAGDALKEAGFSAYDSQGKLKPTLQIWEELASTLDGMNDEDRNGILSAIFPTKTLSGGLALIEAASKGWGGLYDMINETSGGYAAFASLIMESGLGGQLRHLSSVWNATSTKTGGALAEDVGGVADALSGFLEGVNQMDDASFAGLVGGLETIALAGPALIGAGTAIKLMSMIFGTGPGGWIALAGIGVAALAKGLADYSEAAAEADFENQFGTLSFDESALGQFLNGMSEGYDKAAEGIERYNTAVNAAFQDYESYSGDMKQSLLTQLITHAELTPEDEATLQELGTKIQESVIAGINAQQEQDTAMMAALMGDGVGADASDSMWTAILDTLEYGYEDAKAKAASLGRGLREAVTSAFADGLMSQDEIDNIQGLLEQMNDLVARRLAGDDAAARARLISQGQSLGFNGLSAAAGLVYSQRDESIERWADLYFGEGGLYSSAYYANMERVASGQMTQAEMDAQMAFIQSEYQGLIAGVSANSDRTLADVFSAALNESEFGQAWRQLAGFAADGVITDSEYQSYFNGNSVKDLKYARQSIEMMMDAFGGYENVMGLADYFRGTGDMDTAGFYQSILAMYGMGMAATEDQSFGGMQNWRDLLGLGTGYGPADETLAVDADTTAAQAAIDGLNGQTVTVNVDASTKKQEFATGGRAVTASIFGEAGPEWAIPEEHTQRTAELLSAAARASGFTWPELLSRNGGLNAGAGENWTVVYSPTIQAGGSSDLDGILRNDKERLLRLLREQRLHDEIEVYA